MSRYNWSSNAIIFYIVVAVLVFHFGLTIMIKLSQNKIEKAQSEIKKSLSFLDNEINNTKILILESEVERLDIVNEVIENDADYQLKMNGLKERIDFLRNKYNNYETDIEHITID